MTRREFLMATAAAPLGAIAPTAFSPAFASGGIVTLPSGPFITTFDTQWTASPRTLGKLVCFVPDDVEYPCDVEPPLE